MAASDRRALPGMRVRHAIRMVERPRAPVRPLPLAEGRLVTAWPSWVPPRIAARLLVTEEGCWAWTGDVSSYGYGRVGHPRRQGGRLLHRIMWFASGRSIPPGHVLDHLCHDPATCHGGDTCPHRACANPDHMRAVTRAENVAAHRRVTRYAAARNRCVRDHDVSDPASIYTYPDGSRECRECRREAKRRARRAAR